MDPRNRSATEEGNSSRWRRQVIVVGKDGLTLRLIECLVERYDYNVQAVIPSRPSLQSSAILDEARLSRNLRVIESEHITAEVLRSAGLGHADVVVLMNHDDVGNLQLARKIMGTARSINDHELRIVLRMDDRAMGEDIMRLMGEDRVFIVSEAEAVARTFAAAALQQPPPGDMQVWGRRLSMSRRRNDRAQANWAIAANLGNEELKLLPDDSDEVTRYLCLENDWRYPLSRMKRLLKPSTRNAMQTLHRARRVLHTLRHTFNRGLWIGAFVLFAIMSGGMWTLSHFPSTLAPVDSGWDALYVLTLLAGGGTDPDMQAHGWVKATHSVVVLAGSLFIPVVTGAIVQAVIERRYALSDGRMVRPVRGHVVVVGLGMLGIHVVQRLRGQRIPVVVIERRPQAGGVQAARACGAQVLLGDAADPDVLKEAGARFARSLVVTSNNDIESLKIVLAAIRLQPHLPTVLRIFEPGFAARVRERLGMHAVSGADSQHSTYSVSAVGAEFFAHLVSEETILEVIPLKNALVFVCEVKVGPGTRFDDTPVSEMTLPGAYRLTAIKDVSGSVQWDPHTDYRIKAGDQLLILATASALNALT